MSEHDPEDVLIEAYEVTRGDRQNSYGPPDQDFRRTAGMWSALFSDMLKEGVKFEPFHVAQAMILLKMSRQLHQRKRDNWVDTAGYARCGALCDEAAMHGGQPPNDDPDRCGALCDEAAMHGGQPPNDDPDR